MKMKVPSFEMPDMDDKSYPMYVHTPLYSKADVEVTLKMYERQRFDEWVIGHYNQATNLRKVPIFHHNSMDGLNISRKENLFKTSIQIHIYNLEHKVVVLNTRNGRCGISKCHDNDCFSIEIGIAIAWARYCNEEIPDYVLEYSEGK